ncbi:putative reverse transcriptase domain-containing protein [Tanacetum coccineum]
MEEINNFQQESDEILYQAWERFKELLMKFPQKWHNGASRGRMNENVYAAQVGCEQCKGPYYTKDCPQKEAWKTIEEAYYTQFGRPFQGGGYRATAPGESAKIHEENSNLIKEIRASTNAAIRNQGASIKTLEIQIGQMSKNSTPLYKARQTMVPFPSRLDNHYCEEEGNYGPKFTEACGALHINNAIPQKEKDLGSFTIPCFINGFCFDNALVDLGASVSVIPLSTYLNLGLGELVHTRLTVELADRIVKYPKGITKNVLVGIGKFTFPVDFIILDMPEENYIELNDLNEPFKLRRNQGNDLMPTIEECEVIEEFRTRNEDLDTGIYDHPSYCDDDKKIHIDYAHNLKFSCMIGFEFTHANFFPLLYVNMMSRKFHNSIMKNKMVYKGNNVVGALMNVPIFVETFSVMTDFAVLENMDAYRDEGMGDVIFGEPFLREVDIKAKRFEGMITLYKGDDEVNEKDVMNGVSHAYQKLKGFYKGVLKLGPDYIRNAKTKEWLTRGHISVHELD